MNYANVASFQAIDSCGSTIYSEKLDMFAIFAKRSSYFKKTQHSVNYVVYEERAHNKSSSRTDLFRKRSTCFRVGLPRTMCGSVCVLSVLVFKISMLISSDESFGKSDITLSTTCCQRTPQASAAAQLRFVTERQKKKTEPIL